MTVTSRWCSGHKGVRLRAEALGGSLKKHGTNGIFKPWQWISDGQAVIHAGAFVGQFQRLLRSEGVAVSGQRRQASQCGCHRQEKIPHFHQEIFC